MTTSFAERFDAYYNARYDLRLYSECSGYRYEGYYQVWEPIDPIDVEPKQPLELDEYDGSDCAEF